MYQRIETTVRELDPDNSEQLTEVCRLLRERGFKETTEIVRMMHEGSQKEAENARAILMEIGDLAIAPMLSNLISDKPEELVWDMQTILSFHLENQALIVKSLDNMLLDKTVLLPAMISLDVEEEPPVVRVCDQAYLMMRQLFAIEDEETELVNKDLFLDLTDDERDQEISRARESQKWSTLLETE